MSLIIFSVAVACLAIIPELPFELPQNQKTPGQVVREGFFELDANADRAFEFFTPEGERSWAKGWDPKPVFPPQARVAFTANSVFRVDDDQERSLWTIIEASLQRHIAEYVYVVEGQRFRACGWKSSLSANAAAGCMCDTYILQSRKRVCNS